MLGGGWRRKEFAANQALTDSPSEYQERLSDCVGSTDGSAVCSGHLRFLSLKCSFSHDGSPHRGSRKRQGQAFNRLAQKPQQFADGIGLEQYRYRRLEMLGTGAAIYAKFGLVINSYR